MLNHAFSVSFDIVTAESAEDGDTAESGYILESAPLDDAIHTVLATDSTTVDGYTVHANESNGRVQWIAVHNGMDWITGEYESRYLHIPATVTASSTRRIARLLGATVL
jgi:hypothetical protein